jgi:hypothetical protein
MGDFDYMMMPEVFRCFVGYPFFFLFQMIGASSAQEEQPEVHTLFAADTSTLQID